MREIKFRVWHTIEKNMYSVKALEFYGDDMTVGNVKFTLSESMSIYYGRLMQFTGLKDKNGKEIYEGDIVKIGLFALNDVDRFGSEPWKHLPDGVKDDDIITVLETIVVDSDIKSLYLFKDRITSNPDVVGCEIIGNIHENPELLKL